MNRDGLTDLFLGGARGQTGRLLLQQSDGSFRAVNSAILRAHAGYEDIDALMLDYDDDGDLDLYVASGGGLAMDTSAIYQDRLYTNGGFGQLTYSGRLLPSMPYSSATVAAHDYDQDGDLDLFVGGRWRPGRYPESPQSYVLRNEKGAFFSDRTPDIFAPLVSPGLISDAIWADVTGDARAELILVGDWMPIRVFSVDADSGAQELTSNLGLSLTSGFWRVVQAKDLDGDGDLDLIAGNRGLNTQVRISVSQPATILADDFDHNGSLDFIMGYFIQGRQHPVYSRDELLGQIGGLSTRFPTYESYAVATMNDVISRERYTDIMELKAFTSETQVFENDGRVRLVGHPLPLAAQVSTVRAVASIDLDANDTVDLFLAGNDYGNRAQNGRLSAGYGLLLSGDGNMKYEPVDPSGFIARGDVRRMVILKTSLGKVLVVARNNGPISTFLLD